MTLIEMEKEIIKAIRIESKIPLISDVGYKDLIKFVKKLFKEYRGEKKYISLNLVTKEQRLLTKEQYNNPDYVLNTSWL